MKVCIAIATRYCSTCFIEDIGSWCGSLKNVSEFRSRRYKISAVVGKVSSRRFSVTRLHDLIFGPLGRGKKLGFNDNGVPKSQIR